jgi:predicted DNA-binding antitoxin AbrB/MazE fold protein
MQAIKAIYDDGKFMLKQPIPVKGKYEVVITFIEPINEETANISQLANKLPCSTAKGLWKGKVWMSDDFNEPLEEMKEYME